MSLQEKLSLVIIFILIFVVYVLTGYWLLRLIFERYGYFLKEENKLIIWFRGFVFSLALIGIVCFAYSYFIEPYWIEVRNIEIKSSKIPANSKPIRIVHISDIHSEEYVRLEEVLPAKIAEQKPDLIVFSGDSLNTPKGLDIFRNCLKQISQIAPTFVVRGNWDVWYWSKQDLFGDLNVKQLNGNIERVEVNGVPIWLTGIFVESEGKMEETLSTIPKNEFSVFLTHYPDLIEKVEPYNIDLYCAGHTHGGQVAMPLYGALVTFSKFGKKYEGGTYQVGNTMLNVNRGIGMEGGNTPRVRFWARPEITVIDILPK